MTIHLHQLCGCAPTPLAHYLKAIGILRLVAEQKDAGVRGFWRDERFYLLSVLDEGALERFFLEEYKPTPFLSPWNKGSGFYTKDDKGLGPIENSLAARFEPFRRGITEARAQLATITTADARVRAIKERTKVKGISKQQKEAIKKDTEYKKELAAAEREFQRLKADLYVPFALAWRGPHRDWMDAAMVLSVDGRPSWPALLGTGGNDGRLDFTNTAMQRLGDLFDLTSTSGEPTPTAKALLRTSLFDVPSAAMLDAPAGQFLPGAAGGANGTTAPEAGSRINPWDFVLMLEGASAFRSRVTRRLGAQGDMRAAIPFALAAQPVGHATQGDENDTRGEQWMPLWGRAATWDDLTALLGDGRAQLGRSSARRPLDFARAIARLGVARGLTGFARYGYLERNGQSNLAVPLGRLAVAAHPRARLIDEISGWIDRLQRDATDAPARFSVAVGVLTDAAFDVLTCDADPARWQSLLDAIHAVECAQASGTAFKHGPCPLLSSGWLAAADDRSAEWRLALSLGSAARGYKDGRPIDAVRVHALPLDAMKRWRYATGADKRIAKDTRVVMMGRDSVGDLIALVERRLIESVQRGARTLPLIARSGTGATLDDLSRFLAGDLDVERIVALGRGLMAIDWEHVHLGPVLIRARGDRPDEAWEALRLCAVPHPVRERTIATDPAMFRRLASGDVSGAVDLALRRLRAASFRPPISAGFTDPTSARRWAAAFAFPIDPGVVRTMVERFENPNVTETV